MNVFIFCPHHSPDRNPRAFRVDSILDLCRKNNLAVYLNGRNITNETDLRTEPEYRKNKFWIRSKNNPLIQFIRKYVFPDEYILWSLWMSLIIIFIPRNKNDIIITVSNPFSAHLLGLWLKLLNPKTIWFADLGDSFSNNPATQIEKGPLKSLVAQYERMILRYADRIILNSQGILDYYLNEFNSLKVKFELIHNKSKIAFLPNLTTKNKNKSIYFLGSTYNGIRNGIDELKCLEKLISLEPSILGNYRFYFVGHFHQHFLSYLKASELNKIADVSTVYNDNDLAKCYQNADILLNFSNRSYPGLPSKLIEYVESGKPILNFYYDSTEASFNFLHSIENACSINLLKMDYSKITAFITESKSLDPSNFYTTNFESSWIKLLS